MVRELIYIDIQWVTEHMSLRFDIGSFVKSASCGSFKGDFKKLMRFKYF